MNGLELFTRLFNNEIDDDTYIVLKCADHERDTYFSKEEITMDKLLFKDYSYDLIFKADAIKIEKLQVLETKKDNITKQLNQVNEEIERLS